MSGLFLITYEYFNKLNEQINNLKNQVNLLTAELNEYKKHKPRNKVLQTYLKDVLHISEGF